MGNVSVKRFNKVGPIRSWDPRMACPSRNLSEILAYDPYDGPRLVHATALLELVHRCSPNYQRITRREAP